MTLMTIHTALPLLFIALTQVLGPLLHSLLPSHLHQSPDKNITGETIPACCPARAGGHAVRTARPWRGIIVFTHLAREGRLTVTIGRRELLAALGCAAAWPLAARPLDGTCR
jgi:hypothetical protein